MCEVCEGSRRWRLTPSAEPDVSVTHAALLGIVRREQLPIRGAVSMPRDELIAAVEAARAAPESPGVGPVRP